MPQNLQHKGSVSTVPIVALLTDFGLQDQYVASMKGVLLSLNSKIRIVDITHEIKPQYVREAGYVLWSAYRFFPAGTVFVAVVDPGVGSGRNIAVVRTEGYTLIAPANGLLDMVLTEEPEHRYAEGTLESLRPFVLPNVSRTFHGRDVFAPLAVRFLKKGNHSWFGTWKHQETISPFVRGKQDDGKASILHIDRFGNSITNIRMGEFQEASEIVKAVTVGRTLVNRWSATYADAPDHTPCLLVGSNGLVEISIKNESAAQILNIAADAPVRVYWK
jgi:hypothetical protein